MLNIPTSGLNETQNICRLHADTSGYDQAPASPPPPPPSPPTSTQGADTTARSTIDAFARPITQVQPIHTRNNVAHDPPVFSQQYGAHTKKSQAVDFTCTHDAQTRLKAREEKTGLINTEEKTVHLLCTHTHFAMYSLESFCRVILCVFLHLIYLELTRYHFPIIIFASIFLPRAFFLNHSLTLGASSPHHYPLLKIASNQSSMTRANHPID